MTDGGATGLTEAATSLFPVRDLAASARDIGVVDKVQVDLPDLPALIAALADWSMKQRPAMDDIARAIAHYAGDQVPFVVTNLQAAMSRLEDKDSHDQPQIAAWLGQLASACSAIEERVASVVPSLVQLAKLWGACTSALASSGGVEAMLQKVASRMTTEPAGLIAAAHEADASGDPGKQRSSALYPVLMTLRQLSTSPGAVGMALMRGRWAAMASDLSDASEQISADTANELPILVSFHLESVLSDWAAVDAEARAYAEASARAFGREPAPPRRGGLASPSVVVEPLFRSEAMPDDASMNTGLPDQSESTSFLNSRVSWLAINLYTIHASKLPTTLAALATLANAPAGEDYSRAQGVVDAFKGVQDHCAAWGDTYDTVVNLASDMFHYAGSVPGIDALINKEVDAYNAAPDPSSPAATKALANIVQLVGALSTRAAGYSTKADAVSTAVSTFIDQTRADQAALTAQSDPGGAVAQLTAELSSLALDIESWNTTLTQAQADYKHDVIVAATTVTYAWVGFPFCPVGLVAAAIVAGIYGKKATDALAKIDAARGEIAKDQTKANADRVTLAAFTSTSNLVKEVLGQATAALASLETIKGQWSALASDLKDIKEQLAEADPEILILLQAALASQEASWRSVKEKSDSFRTTAYVTVDAPATGLATAAVVAAPSTKKPRRFGRSFKARIVEEAAGSTADEVAALLVAEGLNRSLLRSWRKAAAEGRLPARAREQAAA